MSSAKIVFWDVQHGHSAYLCTPNNRHIVVDLGTGSYASGSEFSPLRHLQEEHGVSRLDYVVITHPHIDHIDDIFSFDAMNPKVLMRPNHLNRVPTRGESLIRRGGSQRLRKIYAVLERDYPYIVYLRRNHDS